MKMDWQKARMKNTTVVISGCHNYGQSFIPFETITNVFNFYNVYYFYLKKGIKDSVNIVKLLNYVLI